MARAADEDGDEFGDALSWAGDEEQGRIVARPRKARADPALVDDTDPHDTDPEDAGTGQPSTGQPGAGEVSGATGRRVATIGFAVPYLALTVGWIFAVQLFASPADLAAGILWQFGEFLTMLAAPLWFAATLTMTGGRRPLVRVGWLALGIGVLLPWPVLIRFLAALQVAGSLS